MSRVKKSNFDEKTINIVFWTLFSSIILFFIFLSTFLLTFSATTLYITILLLFVIFFLSYYLVNKKQTFSLKNLIILHEKRKKILQEKFDLSKKLFKRIISQEDYDKDISNLDEKLFELDFEIENFGIKLTDDEIKNKKLKNLQKLFFKKKISQSTLNKIKRDVKLD